MILALPGVRDLIASGFLKTVGFKTAGISAKGLASLYQSKVLGGYIAKNSLFSYLQSVGALGVFDPTLITFLLVGGVATYYFFMYSRADPKSNTFKWRLKDSLDNK